MSHKPLISIVIPAYNAGPALLRAAVKSALAQTYGNVEVIVVNDASTDNTMTGIDTISDPRLRTLSLPDNLGPSAARNAGTHAARGEWLCYLDADDRILPDMLSRLMDIAETCGADIACCDFQRVALGARIPQEVEPRPVLTATPEAAIAEVLYQTGNLNNSPGGKIFRRELCEKQPWLAGRFEDLRTFYRIFLEANKIAWTAEPFYVYTVNPTSYMQVYTPTRAVVLDVVEEMVEFMAENCPGLVAAARDRALSAAFNILKLMRANGAKEPATAARCKAIIRRYRRASLLNPRVRAKNKAAAAASYLGGLLFF